MNKIQLCGNKGAVCEKIMIRNEEIGTCTITFKLIVYDSSLLLYYSLKKNMLMAIASFSSRDNCVCLHECSPIKR